MTTLLTEIVSEVLKYNPNIASDIVIDGMIKTIEQEILPNVLRRIEILRFPSPGEIRYQELKQKRIKKKFRGGYSIKNLLALWQQFEYVRYQLNGQKGDSSFFLSEETEIGSDKVDSYPIVLNGSSSAMEKFALEKDGIPVVEDLVRGKFEEPSKFESVYPYPTRERLKEEIRPKFVFSDDIIYKVASDPLFRDVLAAIETKLRVLASSYTTKIDFDISLRQDIEISEWTKIILTIDAPEMDFDRKMILWDIVDSRVRQTIEEKMQYVSETERKDIEVLNRNLFTKIELA